MSLHYKVTIPTRMLYFIFHDLLQAMYRLLNCEVNFIKRFYPIYYNVIPYLLWLNVGKTKKTISWLIFSKLMAL